MGVPVILDVTGRACLIVGIGAVGTRKAKQLISAGANVSAISRSIPPKSAQIGDVTYAQGIYDKHHLLEKNPFLVVAATNNEAVNAQIVADAKALGILTMDVSNTSRGDLKGVMQRERDGIAFTITTGVPLLSRQLIGQALDLITPAVATFAAWQRALRGPAKAIVPHQPDRAAMWREVHESDILGLLEAGDEAAARARLRSIVGDELMAHLPEEA